MIIKTVSFINAYFKCSIMKYAQNASSNIEAFASLDHKPKAHQRVWVPHNSAILINTFHFGGQRKV